MSEKYPLAHKIRIPGRTINLYARTDVAKTFARVRREQAELAREQKQKVMPIRRTKP